MTKKLAPAEKKKRKKPRLGGKQSLRVLMLISILLFALCLRLLLAPFSGFGSDVGLNKGWAKSATQLGIVRSYHEQVDGAGGIDYPPFSIMLYAMAGHVYTFLVSPEYDNSTRTALVFVKLPAIFADILTCIAIYYFLKKFRNARWGLIGAAIYAFLPPVFYDSAVWGQTDGIYTLLVLLALFSLATRRSVLVGIFAGLALLTKPQAMAFMPLIGFILAVQGWRQVAKATAGALIGWFLILWPFFAAGSADRVWDVYANYVGEYSRASVAAYNLWWGLMGNQAGAVNDHDLLFGFISYRSVGLLLFSAVYLAMLWFLGKKHVRQKLRGHPADMVPIFLAASVIAYAFYLFNTEMHERYLFAFLALGLPVALTYRRAMTYYLVISGLFLMNLLGVMPYSFIDSAVYSAFPTLHVMVSTANLFLFGMYLRFAIVAFRESPKQGRVQDLLKNQWYLPKWKL